MSETWADHAEIDSFDQFVQDFHAGQVNPDDFRRFRLQHGVYGQRQTEAQMVRVKIPWGGLTAGQLERLADVADLTPRGVGHITTRQNVQYHFVPLADVPALMRSLADVGLTTREACGNTVRNVTVAHCAGICPGEPFDPTPYADALARFLLRNAMNQNLPRKFKIAFSGCGDDPGLTPIHDVGARAVVRDGARGFTIVLGGGLGPAPQLAETLEPFTPAADLLPTVAAVIRVFDRHGNRDNRNLARLKFVVRKLGIDALRALIVKEREVLRLTMRFPAMSPREEVRPAAHPVAHPEVHRAPETPDYSRWRTTCALAQKQPGWYAVHVRLVRGDITGDQLRAVAALARDLGDGMARTTNQQNLIVRWIPAGALPAAHQRVAAAGLARPGAERLVDVTSCPGADTCQLGITSSRGLALVLTEMIERDLGALADDPSVRIKVSGCPNACGQHHIAGIGLFGGARKFHGEQAPTYQLLLGGRLTGPAPRFAIPVARIPARQVPDAVRALLDVFKRERRDGEPFDGFVDRVGRARLAAEVAPWTELPPMAEAPQHYIDWDSEARFAIETGPGECAS